MVHVPRLVGDTLLAASSSHRAQGLASCTGMCGAPPRVGCPSTREQPPTKAHSPTQVRGAGLGPGEGSRSWLCYDKEELSDKHRAGPSNAVHCPGVTGEGFSEDGTLSCLPKDTHFSSGTLPQR